MLIAIDSELLQVLHQDQASTAQRLEMFRPCLYFWDYERQICVHTQGKEGYLSKQSSEIVSVLHQDEGGIGKSIPDGRKISWDPRDFPRAKPEGNLEGRGKSGGQRGWISQYLPSFGGARTISQHQFFYREWIRNSFPVDREGLPVVKSILPCWWWQIDFYWTRSCLKVVYELFLSQIAKCCDYASFFVAYVAFTRFFVANLMVRHFLG